MAERPVETYDGKGNLLGTRMVFVPDEEINAETLTARAVQALATNATYLAIAGTPSNAQNLAQIRALTRECNALIRLLLSRFEDTTGT